MKLGLGTLEAALTNFRQLNYTTAQSSLFESFLTAKWLVANRAGTPSVEQVNEAVAALFVFDANNPFGRIYPFRYGWKSPDSSGRKTVWNNTTRGQNNLASLIFATGDIRRGLVGNAGAIVAQNLAGKQLPSKQALLSLILREHEFQPEADWVTAEQEFLRLLGMNADELTQITDARTIGQPLLGVNEWSLEELPQELAPPLVVAQEANNREPNLRANEMPLLIDDRLKRMLLRSVRAFPFILLCGPPGTGKGAIIRWIVDEVRADPELYGLPAAFDPDPMWRTPDESWSTFDLIGGLVPTPGGELQWSSGLLLDSVSDDRWLVLDEMNRADMDRIMGPLLTWLSKQDVELGRSKAHGGEAVKLMWFDEDAAGGVALNDDDGRPVLYGASPSWRLLGTYNPQDAQRVFRMGQALSRRFVIIPIPAIDVGQFEALMSSRFPELRIDAFAAISGLYGAHLQSAETLLGPAIFLRMGDYFSEDEPEEVLDELVAEAYVASVGKFISAFDDVTFERLGERVVKEEQALPAEQWRWVASKRQSMG